MAAFWCTSLFRGQVSNKVAGKASPCLWLAAEPELWGCAPRACWGRRQALAAWLLCSTGFWWSLYNSWKQTLSSLPLSSMFSNASMLKSLLILEFFPFILANGSYLSQDCKQIKKIKFLLLLNIKSNFIYINILHCYCMDKCEMCYIIKVRTLNCIIIYWLSCGV